MHPLVLGTGEPARLPVPSAGPRTQPAELLFGNLFLFHEAAYSG